MKSMIFRSRLWYKMSGLFTFLWALFMLYVLITSWHIDSQTEWNWVFAMFIVFGFSGVYNCICAFSCRLILSDKSIKFHRGVARNKEIAFDDIQKVIVFKRKSRLKIISAEEKIVVNGTLRYYVTFLRALSHFIPNDRFVFVDGK